MPGDTVQIVIEALKFFENVKPGVEGLAVTGSTLLASAKASVYLIQKGAKSLSILITKAKKAKSKGETGEDKPALTRSHVAIVLDINNRIVTNVENYLESKKIKADLIVITNDPDYSDEITPLGIKKPEEWNELVREFKSHSQKIKRLVGDAKVHIFMAVPVPLAFGLGAVWGTVDNATVYHWQDNSYHAVVKVDRGLRFKA